MRIFLNLIFLFSVLYSFAQPANEYRKYKELVPQANTVVTNYEVIIELVIKDDKVVGKYFVNEEYMYLSDNASSYSERSITSSSFRKLMNYEAYTLVPKTKKYKKVVVEQFTKSTMSDDYTFFNDSEEYQFFLPLLSKGAKSVINREYEIPDPQLIPRFLLSPYMNYYNVTFTIKHHKDIVIAIDTMNLAGVKIDESITEKGNNISHVWEIESPKLYKYDYSGPGITYLAPQIIPRIASYKLNDESINVTSNVDDLHKWYYSLVEKSYQDPAEFKYLSDSIIGNCTNDYDKATKIYRWVQKNIKYIAFEDGYAGYIPDSASHVYEKRYSDCKGMSNILATLLKSQNLDAHLAWVGSRSLAYSYSDVTNTCINNHMIVALDINEKLLFLDPTHSNLEFGVPSPFIQGKDVMINGGSSDKYRIVTAPVVAAENNVFYDSCKIKIIDNNIVGEGTTTLTGYARMRFDEDLKQKNTEDTKKYCRPYLIKGSNKFTIDSIWIENLEDINKPIVIRYKFNIPNYVINHDGNCYINMNFEKVSSPSKIELSRNIPISTRYKYKEISVISIDLDSNQQIKNIPEIINYSENGYYFENKYSMKNNTLERRHSISIRKLLMESAEFEEFNKVVDIVNQSYRKQLIIKTP